MTELKQCHYCLCKPNMGKTTHGHVRDLNGVSYAELNNGYKGYVCSKCFNMHHIIKNNLLPKMGKKIIRYNDEEWKEHKLLLYLDDELVDTINLQDLVYTYMHKHPIYYYQME